MVPLKYLSNIWRSFKTPLINCEISFILTWSANYFIIDAPIATQVPTFVITDTKPYVPFVILWTQDNAKILQQVNQDSNAQLTGININQKQQNRML